ncbi:MAG: 4-hydroxybenzoate octaprenyltransferase, partial [Bacteroidetes bacterium HGW-Bacteroidetes-15]
NALLFIVTTFFINKLAFYLSPVALLVIFGYTYTKRFTILCHFVLGIALSLAPIGAYIAVTGKWALVPILISLVVLFWVSGFDILYSIRDKDFDKEELLRSIPAVLGVKYARLISILLHSIVIFLVIKIGLILETNLFYWIGTYSFIGLLSFQHIFILKCNERRINFAFVTLNGLSSIIFSVFIILSFYL